eukprot:TRINITY_DN30706_c0_g1_i1.p1 TRINITY_DN30706_c0_g1~~TRINITY_DN30706_c0_g1_i1.p1  ORF type:complete len:412 (-),score=100.16 TRINITY_DN30706_c0_g1_i1:77-1312(-)
MIPTRTVGLPTEAIGRVKPQRRGGASSAARARLAQVLDTVKQQQQQPPPQNPLAQEAHECPSCGAAHASDAPHVPPTKPDLVAMNKGAELKAPQPQQEQKQENKSAASEQKKESKIHARPVVNRSPDQQSFVDMLPKITVMGVGGAGCNAVNNMITSGIEGVDFVAVNTDAQSLASSLAPNRIQIGEEGLGAGARPELGRLAVEESMAAVSKQIDGTNLLFITAGMGGGTGTGAASAVAQMARERGILTIGVVSTPWTFEGANRLRMAKAGIAELEHCVDTLITIPNQNLMKINPKLSMDSALDMADSVLRTGVQGVTDLIVSPGLINLDFADVSTVTQNMGRAIMGTGEASGEGRATEAAEAALRNPLLGDVSLNDSQGCLLYTSDAADEEDSGDLGGLRVFKKIKTDTL